MEHTLTDSRAMSGDLREALMPYIRTVPDFPTEGILFKDITPLLGNAEAFSRSVRELAARFSGTLPDAVVAIESRGLIVGATLAYELGVGLVPVRKKGKLPHETYQVRYALEYGEDVLEIHRDAVKATDRVLIVDDLLATGGTVEATIRLVTQCGAAVLGLGFLLELSDLGGRQRLGGHRVESLIAL